MYLKSHTTGHKHWVSFSTTKLDILPAVNICLKNKFNIYHFRKLHHIDSYV